MRLQESANHSFKTLWKYLRTRLECASPLTSPSIAPPSPIPYRCQRKCRRTCIIIVIYFTIYLYFLKANKPNVSARKNDMRTWLQENNTIKPG